MFKQIHSLDQIINTTREICEKYLNAPQIKTLTSYDWWDIWGTSLGSFGKKLYLKNRLIGAFVVGPILLIDILYPNFRRFFVKKRTFPICHAHTGLG